MRRTDDLKPMQPYFVLNSEKFYQEIYLEEGISHFYTFAAGENSKTMTAVPDGCIDIIFTYGEDGMDAYVHGTVLSNELIENEVGKTYFGVRFLPGIMPAILNSQMKDFTESNVPLIEVLRDREFMNKMEQTQTFFERITVFLQEYRKYLADETILSGKKELVLAVKDYVYKAKGKVFVKQLEEYTGYTSRYINKVFDAECGFNPKTFCKIIQFQKTLSYIKHEKCTNFGEVAASMGYYDQPQLIHDFREYAGITPRAYYKLILVKNYDSRLVETRMLQHG